MKIPTIFFKKTITLTILAIATLLLQACGGGSSSNNSVPSSPPQASVFGVVANSEDNTVTTFNAETLAVVAADITLSGEYPHEITLSEDNTTAYIMNRDSNNISIIDIVNGTETGTIELTGEQPAKAAIASNGYLYVTFLSSAQISKVDIAATEPSEDSTIETERANAAIAATPDGSVLYFTGENGQLTRIDTTGNETPERIETFLSDVPLVDIKISSENRVYIAPESGNSIVVFNIENLYPENLQLISQQAQILATDLIIDDGKVFVAVNSDVAGTNTGGVAEGAIDFDITNYNIGSEKDAAYEVDLPFSFNFLETDYASVFMNSNGIVSFEGSFNTPNTDVENILGFAVNNADLDGSAIFGYSSKVYDDRAVFQWLTPISSDRANVNNMVINELVLFSNGQARFDYLFSGPAAINEAPDSSYGVGDNSGTALVNMRTNLGSPFNLSRASYLWNPESPNSISEVDFAWEGTGIHFHPAIIDDAEGAGFVHGVAVTDLHLFMIVSSRNGSDENKVVVYDRNTMLPVNSTITVGSAPLAIAIAEPSQ